MLLTIASLVVCAACERKSDRITETSSFAVVQVTTPPDGKAAIASRARQFAHQHGLKVLFVPDHFTPQEYSLTLIRADLNIAANNVQKSSQSTVRDYGRSAPTSAQSAEVDAYLCELMLHRCIR